MIDEYADSPSAQALQERTISFKQYSHVYRSNHLVHWIFGNATNIFNISISTCVRPSDVVGVYQFENGSMKYDATMSDIMDDLGSGTDKDALAKLDARTLDNTLSARKEMQAFLIDDVLVSEKPPNHPNQRRDIKFESNGRILALVMKTVVGLVLGISAVELATSGHASYGQISAAAITAAGLTVAISIIDLIAQDGGFSALEPDYMQRSAAWVANVFMAMIRRLVMLRRGAPDNGEPRWTESELRAAISREDLLQFWDAETTPGSSSSFGIQGLVCNDSPVK